MKPRLLLTIFLSIYGLCVKAAEYNDVEICDEFSEAANLTVTELEEMASSAGRCIPYAAGVYPNTKSNLCDQFYELNVDTFFLPNGRSNPDVFYLYDFSTNAGAVVNLLRPACQDAAIRTLCYYYFPPCGNITHFKPPNALCKDACQYVAEDVCADEWQRSLELANTVYRDLIEAFQLHLPNCSQPGSALDPLPHCCSDAGIVPNYVLPTNETDGLPGSRSNLDIIIGASVAGGGVAILLVAVVALLVCVAFLRSREKVVFQFSISKERTLRRNTNSTKETPPLTPGITRYVPSLGEEGVAESTRVRIPSFYIRNMSESQLLIPGRHIQLLGSIGKGEFGVVYKAYLTGWQERTSAELVAVKTLKNMFTRRDIEDLIKESEKMMRFKHPNILNLIGVCIDAGDAPYIVMPFMANGSLLVYLRKSRPHLTISEEAGEEMICDAQKKLLVICLQIAKGMAYLAEKMFIHRDLAARNCMIDQNFVIKVADFGLSEDVYSRNYFRQPKQQQQQTATPGGGADVAVKLPIKWMALESLLDAIFTEKTDVWSFGVTCWEVFNLGHTPYPGIRPHDLVQFLKEGGRLEKPGNAACSQQVYELISLCWLSNPDKRPSFTTLVSDLNLLLKSSAGYLDLNEISNGRSPDQRYDHLESRSGEMKRYDHLDERRYGKLYTLAEDDDCDGW